MKQCKQCGKQFKPKTTKQQDCTEQCLVNRFDKRAKKTLKLARIFADTMGYRSMGEVRFAARLKNSSIPFEYETEQLQYQHTPQKYTVDFILRKSSKIGKTILIEYKGKLDNASRRKMRAVKKSNPDAEIWLIFEKPNNKLYKGAKSRYWEWAEKQGFCWYDSKDIKKLKHDLGKV